VIPRAGLRIILSPPGYGQWTRHFSEVALLKASDCTKEKAKLSLYRPWRPIGLREVEAPTFFRHWVHRWWEGCQPYAPAAL
jgi:hypothetical protein